jgi:hypothetical protein
MRCKRANRSAAPFAGGMTEKLGFSSVLTNGHAPVRALTLTSDLRVGISKLFPDLLYDCLHK